MDIGDTLAAKSDQIGADDLIGGERLVTITRVKVAAGEQPASIFTAEFGDDRPFKPCLTMRRALTALWGPDSSTYTGRRMVIYRDAEVTFGNDKPGGVRISHVSHIDKTTTVWLKAKRGKSKPYTFEPLPDALVATPKPPSADKIIAAFEALGVTLHQLETRVGCGHGGWTADEITALAALGKAIKAGGTSTFEEFEIPAEPQDGA